MRQHPKGGETDIFLSSSFLMFFFSLVLDLAGVSVTGGPYPDHSETSYALSGLSFFTNYGCPSLNLVSVFSLLPVKSDFFLPTVTKLLLKGAV